MNLRASICHYPRIGVDSDNRSVRFRIRSVVIIVYHIADEYFSLRPSSLSHLSAQKHRAVVSLLAYEFVLLTFVAGLILPLSFLSNRPMLFPRSVSR